MSASWSPECGREPGASSTCTKAGARRPGVGCGVTDTRPPHWALATRIRGTTSTAGMHMAEVFMPYRQAINFARREAADKRSAPRPLYALLCIDALYGLLTGGGRRRGAFSPSPRAAARVNESVLLRGRSWRTRHPVRGWPEPRAREAGRLAGLRSRTWSALRWRERTDPGDRREPLSPRSSHPRHRGHRGPMDVRGGRLSFAPGVQTGWR